MSYTNDIAALVTRQTAAVASAEASATAMAAFLNNDANTPVPLPGGGTSQSMAAAIAAAAAAATRRNYEINWSLDDISGYGAGLVNMFRVRPATPVTFAFNLVGSYFSLDTAPLGGSLVIQLKLGTLVVSITFPNGSATPQITGMVGPVVVPAGTEIKAIIPGNINGAKGLVMSVLGTTG